MFMFKKSDGDAYDYIAYVYATQFLIRMEKICSNVDRSLTKRL